MLITFNTYSRNIYTYKYNNKQIHTARYLTHNYYGDVLLILKVITDEVSSCSLFPWTGLLSIKWYMNINNNNKYSIYIAQNIK